MSDGEKKNNKQTEKTGKRPKFISAPYEAAMTELIERHFPEIKIRNLQIKTTGTEGIIASLNNDLVIKAPKPSRGLEGIRFEHSISRFLQEQGIDIVPDIDIVNEPIAFIWYKKKHGESLRSLVSAFSEKEMERVAAGLSRIMHRFHKIPLEKIESAGLEFSPSWSYSHKNLKKELREMLPEELHALYDMAYARLDEILSIPDEYKVFGHFDLHGSNILLKEKPLSVSGIIDLGNVMVGDYHDELSKMNMNSVPLTERIITQYEKISGRQVDRERVKLFSSVYLLSILMGKLPDKKDTKNYKAWLDHVLRWNKYVNGDTSLFEKRREKKALAASQQQKGKHAGTEKISFEWRKWVAVNLVRGVPEKAIKQTMVKRGIRPEAADREISRAKQHPYVAACKEIKAGSEPE